MLWYSFSLMFKALYTIQVSKTFRFHIGRFLKPSGWLLALWMGTGYFTLATFISFQIICLSLQKEEKQVVANLANFSYDPLNFAWLREAKVPSLFLEVVSAEERIPELTSFALAGICNISIGMTGFSISVFIIKYLWPISIVWKSVKD